MNVDNLLKILKMLIAENVQNGFDAEIKLADEMIKAGTEIKSAIKEENAYFNSPKPIFNKITIKTQNNDKSQEELT